MSTEYQRILEQIRDEVRRLHGRGKVADYIPALARVAPGRFGLAVKTVRGEEYAVGDAEEPFSVQSISKLFTLTMAMSFARSRLWRRVGREPSGTPFNSLVQLEYERGIPRNPFINAGALVVTDVICSHTERPAEAILEFIGERCGSRAVEYDREVARSEQATGHRNAALAHLLKSFGNLENEVERVLGVYFQQCALRMSCLELARSCLYLANEGANAAGEVIIGRRQTKRINALMMTCGTYDVVGDFAYRVGLPAKSGVGGGIVAVLPRVLCAVVWSPELNAAGNSLAGTRALELLTTKTAMSVF